MHAAGVGSACSTCSKAGFKDRFFGFAEPANQRERTVLTLWIAAFPPSGRCGIDPEDLNKELVDIGALIRKAAAVAHRDSGRKSPVLEVPRDTIHVHGDHVALSKAMLQITGRVMDVNGEGGRIQANVKHGGTLLVIQFLSSDGMAHVPFPAEAEHILIDHGGSIHGDGPWNWVVELPLAVMPRAQMNISEMEDRNNKCRVLVVDDNVDGAVTLSVIIKHLGHSVRITHDGAAAIAVAQEFKPELILMDIGMPGMDGYETCQRIRQEDWSTGVQIVALTGWGQEEDKRKAMRAGFDKHLVKPVDRKTLMEVLDSVPVSASDRGGRSGS